MRGSEHWDWGNIIPAPITIESHTAYTARNLFRDEYFAIAERADLLPAVVGVIGA